jgi:hypothetical protein
MSISSNNYVVRKQVATVAAVLIIALVVIIADQMKTKATASTSFVAVTSPTSTTTDTATSSPTTSVGAATPSASTPTPAQVKATSAVASSPYKNGSYSAASDYNVPRGSESIQVNVTLNGGIVTAVSIQNSENDNTSAQYQADFTAAYKRNVVGKNISGLRLNTISGASDTTQGFNYALSQIVAKAQA